MGDFRGYYEDGAYVAYADSHAVEEEGEQDTSERGSEFDDSESAEDRPRNSSADEIRDAYFASITTRYIALRKRLQTGPPHGALDALPASNPPEVGAWKRGLATFQIWEGRLRGTDPLPAQIAAMHKDSVFRLLRILLTTKFLRTGSQVRERTSRWLWALLARLPDKGELDYMEVGWVRELGKRAVLLMVSLAELEVLKEHYDVAGSSAGDQDEYEVNVDVDDCFSDITPSGDIPLDPADAPTPDMVEDDELALDSKASATKSYTRQTLHDPINATPGSNNASLRTPNHDEASDVEMQLDSDMEDGEVADEPPSPRSDHTADIEAAKARLLAQLDGDIADGGEAEDCHPLSASAMPVTRPKSTTPPITSDAQTAPTPTEADADQEEGEYEPDDDDEEAEDDSSYRELDRAKVNERATLNMILTVAGEFYGQRDLLEFRDPFGGL